MIFNSIQSLKAIQIRPGMTGRFIHTDQMTFSYWHFEKDTILPLHSHHNEQISMVIKGRLELTIDGQTRIMEAGMVAMIPPNVPHSAVALTDCEVTDVFTPHRDDLVFE